MKIVLGHLHIRYASLKETSGSVIFQVDLNRLFSVFPFKSGVLLAKYKGYSSYFYFMTRCSRYFGRANSVKYISLV